MGHFFRSNIYHACLPPLQYVSSNSLPVLVFASLSHPSLESPQPGGLPRYTQDNMSRESDSVLPPVRHSRRREGPPALRRRPCRRFVNLGQRRARADNWVQRSSNQNGIERNVRVPRRKPLHVHLPHRSGVIRLHRRGGLPPRPFHLAK